MDLNDQLWQMANIVTGFYVAQSVSMCYAFVKKDTREYFEGHPHVRNTIAILNGVVIFYIYVIVRTWQGSSPTFEHATDLHIWNETFIWRLVAIIYFLGLTMFTLYLDPVLNFFAKKKESSQP